MSDFDTELANEILHQIKSSCDLIISRVETIIANIENFKS